MLRLLPFLLLLTACSANLDPSVEIGTGEIEFVPLESGETLQIIQGPQGGFHLLASLRVHGIIPGDRGNLEDASNPTITFDVIHEGASLISIGPITQGLDSAPLREFPYTHQMTGRFAILDINADDELDGETVSLSVHIEAEEEIEISDSVTIDLVPHPANF